MVRTLSSPCAAPHRSCAPPTALHPLASPPAVCGSHLCAAHPSSASVCEAMCWSTAFVSLALTLSLLHSVIDASRACADAHATLSTAQPPKVQTKTKEQKAKAAMAGGKSKKKVRWLAFALLSTEPLTPAVAAVVRRSGPRARSVTSSTTPCSSTRRRSRSLRRRCVCVCVFSLGLLTNVCAHRSLSLSLPVSP
jgi:hypothetical protein